MKILDQISELGTVKVEHVFIADPLSAFYLILTAVLLAVVSAIIVNLLKKVTVGA